MKRLSGFKIMQRLIKELKPLSLYMLLTIILGVLGFLAAMAVALFAAIAAADIIGEGVGIGYAAALTLMLAAAILRGPLRYSEQLCGHYIAFKILVILRDKVFLALRRLAPARLEEKEKGDLVSLVTSDIELLEVFYAHTIAPIAIAVITNSLIAILLYHLHPAFGVTAAALYIIVGFCIPYFTSSLGKQAGVEYRQEFARTNSYLLDSLRGLREVLIYGNGADRAENIRLASVSLNEKQGKIKRHEGMLRGLTDLTILLSIVAFLLIGSRLAIAKTISFGSVMIAVTLIATSFGPVVALSNLSNNLLLTFASAQRLFDLLDEDPEVEEVSGNGRLPDTDIAYSDVTFGYSGRGTVLENVNIDIKKGERIAIIGKSGTGKSTFAKLLMRFWDPGSGEIKVGGVNLRTIATNTLRANEVLMSQDTYLFNDTVEDNIRLARPEATTAEIKEAASRAAIHDFIMSLPKGYKTKVDELGSNFSSGERQRIGLARVFLSKADILILDEPTSNLDTLNEAAILKAVEENIEDKTILLITHRRSTASICSKALKIEDKHLLKEGG